MRRIERMREQLQLHCFLGVRSERLDLADPQKIIVGGTHLLATRRDPPHPLNPPHPLRPSVLDASQAKHASKAKHASNAQTAIALNRP